MNTPSVEQLRKNGFKVRIMHWRNVNKEAKSNKEQNLLSASKFYRRGDTFSLKGGKTIVELTSPGNKNVRGVSQCSYQDNFTYKIGTQIAVKNALEQLKTPRKSLVGKLFESVKSVFREH